MSKAGKLIRNYYSYFILAAAFGVLLFWNAFYLENWLDSDMAAEMMFSGGRKAVCHHGLVLFHGIQVSVYPSDHGTVVSYL